jgi:cystathionine beta-lyase/cystathionine gamma-synthase
MEPIRFAQIDTGGILAPFEAWLILRSLGTLALRMDRICGSALALARALEAHPAVERVHYPGLPSHPQHDLARALLGERFGGMLSFEVSGGIPAGKRFLERVRIATPAASLGGTKTLVVHPASVTHTQLARDEREAMGISDGLIRVSVGIEDVADLIADVEGALS